MRIELIWPGLEFRLVKCPIGPETWVSVSSKQVVVGQLRNSFFTRSLEKRYLANAEALRLKMLAEKVSAK